MLAVRHGVPGTAAPERAFIAGVIGLAVLR